MTWSTGSRARIKALIPGILIASSVFLLSFLISGYCFQLVLVRDASMEPAFRDGQILVLDKLHREYRRGDVVVFEAPQLGEYLIKRIAAGPGDRVEKDGTICYNGTQDASGGYLLAEGEFFLLGDNASESIDSRDERIGIVSREQILGKILR